MRRSVRVRWKCILVRSLDVLTKLQNNAAFGHPIFRHSERRWHGAHIRTRAQCADEGRESIPRVRIHDNGGTHVQCRSASSKIDLSQGRDVDLLFGLDMLKAHQACIDLEKNVLRIQGREVPFLAEHELPEKARAEHGFDEELQDQAQPSASGPPHGHHSSSSTPGRPSGSRGSAPSFPGSGNTLGSTPSHAPAQSSRQAPAASRFPENDITTLVNLGVTREQAISMLEAAGGNVEVAASLMF